VPQRHWEDLTVGAVFEHGPRLVTREEILAFAAAYDPQPMHLDEAAARASMLGGLCASGWHICALAMRMIHDGILVGSAPMGSPGVEEVRWLQPLRPDDAVRLRATVLDTRVSTSRPEAGFVRFHFELVNQHDAAVMRMTSSLIQRRRAAATV
jgi:acyl dehydratase